MERLIQNNGIYNGDELYSNDKMHIDQEKDRIEKYWARRSQDFAALRIRELHHPIAKRWLKEIEHCMPQKRPLHILDIGTGSGFFAFLLENEGYHVTGIDLTPAMIEEADKIKQESKSSAAFLVMDAEELLFEDETFDMIVTRNLSWTLPSVERAYLEWFRVLKKGGVLLNFDGDYGKDSFAKEAEALPENHVHKSMDDALLLECEKIKEELEISRHERPLWDIELLEKAGFNEIAVDYGISQRIYTAIDEFYNPTPLFSIKATK